MTNNPTIDGVSRELLADLVKIASRNVRSAWSGGICEEARALLDAPVVERQELKGSGSLEFDGLLAEFHAIVWASAEDGDCDYDLAGVDTAKKLQAMFRAQAARIAELESGKGEIVGFRYRANGEWEWMDESPFADGRTHYKLGNEELQPLYTAPSAPVAVVLPERLQEILKFLDGAGPLDGIYFGERHHTGRKFWWRNELRACLDATAALNEVKP